jgi:putative FmdB family regulatory protein
MPLYEYQCDKCGHRFEVIQKYSDPPIAVCPKCGGEVHKLFSSPAIQFKGSGFYITDYARAGKSESEGGSTSKGEGSNGTAEKKTDAAESKSEAKAESKGTAKGESKSDSKAESKGESKSSSKPSASKPESN